jgi:hypothetical protein
MNRMLTTRKKWHWRMLTVLGAATTLGVGLVSASPAHADRDRGPDVGFRFFFGLPAPPPPPPPAVYYYEPAPRIVYRDRPYYRDYRYRDRYWRDRHHRPHDRPWRDHDHDRYRDRD